MDFQFLHKEFTWLFIALAIFILHFFFLLRWKKSVVKKMGDVKFVKELIKGYSPGLFSLKFCLLSIAFTAGVVAVMDLRKPGGAEGINRNGIDIVIALDVSKSMLATDMAPNRLERARHLIGKLIDAMPNDRIGLVLFAGQAYLQMPLTTDHSAARMFIESAGTEAVPQQGTVLSEAIQRSASAFNTTERRYKAVVLISDGEGHDEEAVKTAKELSEQGLMINTVGVGSPQGSYIPDQVTGQNKIDPATGSAVVSKLNEEVLKQIAIATNGIYIRLQESEKAVLQLQKQLAQIESKAFGDVSLMNFKVYYWWFAAAMLIILLIEYFIPEVKKIKSKI